MNVMCMTRYSHIKIPHSLHDWLLILLNALAGVVGQWSATLAFRIEEASLVSIMRTFDIVMAFIYQALFLTQQPVYWTSILGSVLICSSCIVLSTKKFLDSKRKQ